MNGKMKGMAWGMMGLLLLVAGCGNAPRDATEAAINAAQGAIDAVQAEAQTYVPEQVDAARRTLQSARDALAKSDYQSALNAAQDAATKAREMAAAAVGKKQEWTRTWRELNESLPKAMDQVKARLDVYSRRPPADLEAEVLDAAKAEYATMRERWAEASEAANRGNLRDAVEKATGAKELLEKLREELGIKVKVESQP